MEVTLGLNNDNYIEVTDGLAEGDEIAIPSAAPAAAAGAEELGGLFGSVAVEPAGPAGGPAAGGPAGGPAAGGPGK